MTTQVAAGVLFGLAIGDALGASTEFLSVPEILQRWPPHGPTAPEGDPARVTDDTQMALAVGEALVEHAATGEAWSAEGVVEPLRRAFVAWYHSPENDRAPGNTCLRACQSLGEGRPWPEATVAESKGCGANMRVPPVGLLADVTDLTRAALAQLQAALTHGHPTALAASDLTAYAVADLGSGGSPSGLPGRLHAYAQSQRRAYHAAWLGRLWQRPLVDSPEQFIARGWDECLEALGRVEAAVVRQDRDVDPCLLTGQGWTAEEAIATALLCFLLFPDDAGAAVRRAAVTSGDSDSIACLTGALAGAHLGLTAWPEDWLRRIEYRDRLAAVAACLDHAT